MSLEALNYPPLVAVAGAAALGILPRVEHVMGHSMSWTAVRTANLLAYGMNLWAVSQPGRIDGAAAAAASVGESSNDNDNNKNRNNKKKNVPGREEMEQMSTGPRGRTLVAPSGWAFAIWGPIFAGELLSVGAQWLLPETAPVVPLLRTISGPFVMAQTFQSLWTASFRPKYYSKKGGQTMYISVFMLSSTAYSLSRAHAALAASNSRSYYSVAEYVLMLLPLTMHFGWTTAASLVNLNGAFAIIMSKTNKSARTHVAWLGHASVVAATALGVAITVTRSAPVYGGVITWALLAVADGMTRRLNNNTADKEDSNRVGVYGARVQRVLARVGACLTGGTTVVTAAMLFRGGKQRVAP